MHQNLVIMMGVIAAIASSTTHSKLAMASVMVDHISLPSAPTMVDIVTIVQSSIHHTLVTMCAMRRTTLRSVVMMEVIVPFC